MSAQQEGGAYEPRPGDQVTVRRYITPTHGERTLETEHAGVITEAVPHADGWYIQLDSYEHRIFTGYQFLGAGSGLANETGPASLLTEVIPGRPASTEHATWAYVPGERGAFVGVISAQPDVDRFEPGGQEALWTCTHRHRSRGDASKCAQAELGRRAQEQPAPDLTVAVVSPDLTVAVDGSGCIVLLVTDGAAGKLLRKVTVTDVDAVKAALDDARLAQRIALEEAERARLCGADEKRRSEGRLNRHEAMEWLVSMRGWGGVRGLAVRAVDDMRAGADSKPAVMAADEGMGYADGYWTVPVTSEQTAR